MSSSPCRQIDYIGGTIIFNGIYFPLLCRVRWAAYNNKVQDEKDDVINSVYIRFSANWVRFYYLSSCVRHGLTCLISRLRSSAPSPRKTSTKPSAPSALLTMSASRKSQLIRLVSFVYIGCCGLSFLVSYKISAFRLI